MIDQLETNGFAIVTALLSPRQVAELGEALAPLLQSSPVAGIRGLAERIPAVRALAHSSPLRALVESILGSEARLVRSILFNKSQTANWQVAWHQDLVIAVRDRAEAKDFAAWSVKEGVPHVQPPMSILEQMLTVRLHLDAAGDSNGALWVSPGTHRLGRLPASDAAEVAEHHGKHLCAVAAGDALLFRPLLLHASRKATSPQSRRVIHLEFAAATLPFPLTWAEA